MLQLTPWTRSRSRQFLVLWGAQKATRAPLAALPPRSFPRPPKFLLRVSKPRCRACATRKGSSRPSERTWRAWRAMLDFPSQVLGFWGGCFGALSGPKSREAEAKSSASLTYKWPSPPKFTPYKKYIASSVVPRISYEESAS